MTCQKVGLSHAACLHAPIKSFLTSHATARTMFVLFVDILTAASCVQDAENNWQFDIFGFADATPGNSLSMLGFHLIQTTGLLKEFGLNATKMAACFRKIESGYNPTNPYHNRYVW